MTANPYIIAGAAVLGMLQASKNRKDKAREREKVDREAELEKARIWSAEMAKKLEESKAIREAVVGGYSSKSIKKIGGKTVEEQAVWDAGISELLIELKNLRAGGLTTGESVRAQVIIDQLAKSQYKDLQAEIDENNRQSQILHNRNKRNIWI